MQKVDIINLALARIGTASITTLNDGSEEAAKAAAVWDGALRSTLQAYRWGFNTRRSALALVTEDPEGYAYKYAYGTPSDMLQPYEIFDAVPQIGRPIPFIYEDGKIYTDKDNAILVYGVYEDRCSVFTPAFTDALSWRLAGDLSIALTQRTDYTQMAQRNFDIAISQARSLAGNSRRPKHRDIPQYIQARS